jgi:hypothetical protein
MADARTVGSPWPEAVRRVLPSGLTVIAQRAPYPVAALTTTHQVGFRDEDERAAGMAHLIEHLVCRAAARDDIWARSTADKAAWLAESRRDYTVFGLVVPSQQLVQASAAEARRMTSLAVDNDDLPAEVAIIQREYRNLIESRRYGLFPAFLSNRHLFDTAAEGGDGYGLIDGLQRLEPEDVTTFFEKHYTAARTIVSVVGDLDEYQILEAVSDQFSTVHRNGEPRAVPPIRPRLQTDRRAAYRRTGVPDALAMAWRVPDPCLNFAGYVKTVLAWWSLCAGNGPLSLWLRAQAPEVHPRCTVGTFNNPWDMRIGITLVLELAGSSIDVLRRMADQLRNHLPALVRQLSSTHLDRTAQLCRLQLARQLDHPLHRARQLGTVDGVFDGHVGPDEPWLTLSAGHVGDSDQSLADLLDGSGCLFLECTP